MQNLVRAVVINTWVFLRTTCLVAGMCVAFLLGAEGCYRGYRTVREATAGRPAASAIAKPTATPWYADYEREYTVTRKMQWRPYVYFGTPKSYRGRYVNIDSLGHRVTPLPSPAADSSARPVKVFFMGGSTMWGTGQRDDHTIPAEAARRLQSLVAPGERLDVTNFGQIGYVMTQGVVELMLQLRAGNTPDIVVFYDGINDVGSATQSGVAGIPLNEYRRVTEFELGRTLDHHSFDSGLRKDVRALGVLATYALDQFDVIDRIEAMVPRRPPALLPADTIARRIAETYVGTARLVEGLGRAYGFVPVFVWQPTLQTTEKRLTPFEQQLLARYDAADADDFRTLRQVHRRVPVLLDSLMPDVVPDRFVSQASLFRGDSLPVFIDRVGHTTEQAVPVIVDGFWPVLQTAFAQRAAALPSPVSVPRRVRSN